MTDWGAYPAPSSPSLQSGGPFLADCLSGFPAFAENDGRTGVLTRTLVTLAAKRGAILG